MLVPEATR